MTIRSTSGKKEKLETWRYLEIVGTLQWMHMDRQTAYDTAKWCIKARPGDKFTDLKSGIFMEVTET